jgi:undecaprenyl diphosphate synthase
MRTKIVLPSVAFRSTSVLSSNAKLAHVNQLWLQEDNDTTLGFWIGSHEDDLFQETLAHVGSILFFLLGSVVFASVLSLLFLEIRNRLFLQKVLKRGIIFLSFFFRMNHISNDIPYDFSDVRKLTIPRHIAVIMDGNRRYGRSTYGFATKGHADGGKTLSEFILWCKELGVEALTVYAFSTENWNRDPAEVKYLMSVFEEYSNKILKDSLKHNVCVKVLASEKHLLPKHIQKTFDVLETETRKKCPNGFQLNLCVSYGGRSEIAQAAKHLAVDVKSGKISSDDINEAIFSSYLLTSKADCVCDPDLLIRTSGEIRLSNFLLYQLAYTEMVFVEKNWPEFGRADLLEAIAEFTRRKRRFGK